MKAAMSLRKLKLLEEDITHNLSIIIEHYLFNRGFLSRVIALFSMYIPFSLHFRYNLAQNKRTQKG